MKEYKGYKVSKDGSVIGRRGQKVGYSINGYQAFSIEAKPHYIHRVVWEVFNGEIPAGKEIDHIDRDKTNNNLNNLRLVTHSENQLNRNEFYRMKGRKLTGADVTFVRDNYPMMTIASLAEKLGVGSTTIHSILLKKSYRNI